MEKTHIDHYVITIARGFGTGGKKIGQHLSDELGIAFYDRKLLRLASDDSGINEALFGRADETLRGTTLFKVAQTAYHGEVIGPDSDDFLSNENLFRYQAKVIRGLAMAGPCVIVGRCADYVLKDFDNVLRVFIHAPLEACVKRVQAFSALSEKGVARLVKDTDKTRAGYYRYYTGQEWECARNYDLCLNSAEFGQQRCVSLIKDYLTIKLAPEKDPF